MIEWKVRDTERLMEAIAKIDPWQMRMPDPWNVISCYVGKPARSCQYQFDKIRKTMGGQAR